MEKFKIAVYSADQGLAGFVVVPGTDEIMLFDDRVKASMFAQKLRKESSLGVWFRIEEHNEVDRSQKELAKL